MRGGVTILNVPRKRLCVYRGNVMAPRRHAVSALKTYQYCLLSAVMYNVMVPVLAPLYVCVKIFWYGSNGLTFIKVGGGGALF